MLRIKGSPLRGQRGRGRFPVREQQGKPRGLWPARLPYLKGLGSLFRNLVSPLHYYYLCCAGEKPAISAYTEWSWTLNPRFVQQQSPSCFTNTADRRTAQPRRAACTSAGGVGDGGPKSAMEASPGANLENYCPAPPLPPQADLPPSTHGTCSFPQTPHCQPAPSCNSPHTCSVRTGRAPLMAPLALGNQTGNRYIRKESPCLGRLYWG